MNAAAWFPPVAVLVGIGVLVREWLGGGRPSPGVLDTVPVPGSSPPPSASLPAANASLDAVVAYLHGNGRYGQPQADAARVLRAALVDVATLPPQPEAKP